MLDELVPSNRLDYLPCATSNWKPVSKNDRSVGSCGERLRGFRDGRSWQSGLAGGLARKRKQLRRVGPGVVRGGVRRDHGRWSQASARGRQRVACRDGKSGRRRAAREGRDGYWEGGERNGEGGKERGARSAESVPGLNDPPAGKRTRTIPTVQTQRNLSIFFATPSSAETHLIETPRVWGSPKPQGKPNPGRRQRAGRRRLGNKLAAPSNSRD